MSPQSRKIKSALALTAALGMFVPAAASAKLPPPDPVPSSHPVVFVQTTHSGFDWGDAGIGAAGGLGITLLAVGGGIAVARRGERHVHGPTGATS